MFYVFLLSAFFRNFFLCQDHWHGNVSPHLGQPCYVALGWTLDSGLMLFLMVFFFIALCFFVYVFLPVYLYVFCTFVFCFYVLYFFIQMQILLFFSVTLCVFFPSLLMFLLSSFFRFHRVACVFYILYSYLSSCFIEWHISYLALVVEGHD